MPIRGLRKFFLNVGRKYVESKARPQTLPITNEVADPIHLLQEIFGLCRYFRKLHLRRWCAVNGLCSEGTQATRTIAEANEIFVQVRDFEHR